MSEDVKAGTYELVALQWDQQTSKPGEPFDFTRHRRGDKVTLDADDARRLVRAGAVTKPGERQKAEAERAKAAYAAAVAQLPDDIRAEVAGDVALPEPEQSKAPKSSDK